MKRAFALAAVLSLAVVALGPLPKDPIPGARLGPLPTDPIPGMGPGPTGPIPTERSR